MRIFAPFLAVMTFVAPVAAATPDEAAAFLGAMREADCDLSLEAADEAAEALEIEIEALDRIIDLMFVGGQFMIDAEDHMTMIAELCEGDPADDASLYVRLQADIDLEAEMEPFFGAPASPDAVPTPERGALFMSALRGAGCAVHRAEAASLVAAAGITPAEAETASAVLFETGHMQFGATPQEMRLSEEACASEPAGDRMLFEAATAMVVGTGTPVEPDVVLADRFDAEGIRAVLEFLADTSDCVLDISDREGAIDSVMAFLAFNVTGLYNLPSDFSPEAEAALRARIDEMLDAPGPAFEAAPGQLTLIDCTP